MINPNALPTSPTVQDFQNLESALDSPDYNNTLQAMRYMQGQKTGGLNRLPQVTVPMQEGGMMEEAMMEQQMPIEPMNPEEQAMMMQQVEQQEPREPNPEIQAMAQQVASFGRGGDKLLLHIRPDEMQGLSSMLTVTINPTTGMPEVFLNRIARAGRRIVKGAAKGVKKVTSSKAFKTIAPIALAIAAPMVLPQLSPMFASGGIFAGSTALGAGVQAGLGSLAGNLLAGRKFGDAAKAALISGATAGAFKGISNKLQPDIIPTTVPEGAGDSYQAAGMKLVPSQQVPSTFTGSTADAIPDLTGEGMINKVTGKSIPSNIADMRYGEAATQSVLPVGTRFSSPAVEQAIAQAPITSSYTPPQPINILARGEPSSAFTSAKTPLGALESQQALLEAQARAPVEQTFASRLGDAKDAVVQGFKDRYTLDKSGLMNLGKDVLVGDIGASAVEMDNAQQQALEDQQLADAGYSVSYPSGFGTQRVIRDSSGVVVNATAQDILARALGGGRMQFAPQTTFAPTAVAAQGGLIELAQGGEFSGMVPGQGGGMDDNVYMPIKEGNKQVGTLAVSPTEYVVDSYTMAALGDGNPDEGAKVMDRTIKQIRKKAYGTTKQPNEIDGLAALRPMAQGV
ncbi:hypothetical protein [uncultured virus]|uniref:Uncharacterized protein n=1 Tax=uncultured virus TaxID=340016 RepID=A0A218MKW5_9VIRU|nr:hypothetical protein [uncultured virus]